MYQTIIFPWRGPGLRLVDVVRLMVAFIKGDEVDESLRQQRFDEIVGNYSNMIARLCYGYSRSASDFDDLRQDTLVNVWQGLRHFRGDSQLRTWVYRVTLNTCVSSLRNRNKERNLGSLLEYIDVADFSQEQSRMLSELYEAIGRLPELDKAIIMMWLDGNTYDEIAEVIGISRNNVATRIHRAKEKLKTL